MNNDDKLHSRELTGNGFKKAEPIQPSSPIPAKQEQTLTVQQAIDIAVQYHQSGDVSKAVDIFQQILQADPNQPIALHFLGLIAHTIGRSDRAVKLISDAIQIKPEYAEAHCNLGNALKELGKLDDAISSY